MGHNVDGDLDTQARLVADVSGHELDSQKVKGPRRPNRGSNVALKDTDSGPELVQLVRTSETTSNGRGPL